MHISPAAQIITGDHRGRDFSGQDLSGWTFEDANLDGANFAGCDLSLAVFRNSNASNANFEGACLHGAHFEQSTLQKVNFKKTHVNHTKPDAWLNGYFTSLKIKDCDFSEACLDDAIWPFTFFTGEVLLKKATLRSTDLRACRAEDHAMDFSGALLIDTRLEKLPAQEILREDSAESVLRGANFQGATLHRVKFTSAKLAGAYFREATITDGDFSYAEAGNSFFLESHIRRGNFTGADLQGADFSYALGTLDDADGIVAIFDEANLQRAKFIAARIYKSSFCKATLTCADLTRAWVHGCDFTKADLRQATFVNATLENNTFSGAIFFEPVNGIWGWAHEVERLVLAADIDIPDALARWTGTDVTPILKEGLGADQKMKFLRLKIALAWQTEKTFAPPGTGILVNHASAAELSPDLVIHATAKHLHDAYGIKTLEGRHEGLNLQGQDYRGAIIRNAVLRGANLAGIRLNEALLYNVDLSEADLTAADLQGAKLVNCLLRKTALDGVNLDYAELYNTTITAGRRRDFGRNTMHPIGGLSASNTVQFQTVWQEIALSNSAMNNSALLDCALWVDLSQSRMQDTLLAGGTVLAYTTQTPETVRLDIEPDQSALAVQRALLSTDPWITHTVAEKINAVVFQRALLNVGAANIPDLRDMESYRDWLNDQQRA